MYQEKNFKNTILQNSQKILAKKKLFFSTWFLVMFLHIAYFFYAFKDYTVKSHVLLQDKNSEIKMINFLINKMNLDSNKYDILLQQDWLDSINETYQSNIYSNKKFKITKILFIPGHNNKASIYFKVDDTKNISSFIDDAIFELELESEKFFHKLAAEKIFKTLNTTREVLMIERALDPQGTNINLINDTIDRLDKIINLQFLNEVIKLSSVATNKVYKKKYEFNILKEVNKYHFFFQSLLLSFLITMLLLIIYNNKKKLFSI